MSPDPTGYREAMKATSITGTSSLVQVLVGMVRSKVVAVIVGPTGIGMFGILTSATGLIGAFVGLGINSSGVRQVAAAGGDEVRAARVIYVLRRTSVALGMVGMLAVLLFARPIARLSAGSEQYAPYLMLLAPLVLFTTVNGGQTALLRGLRRISTLARVNIFGAVAGTVVSIPFVVAMGLNGIAPAMLVTAAVTLAASWWYARQVRIPSVSLSLRELKGEVGGLVSLGAVFFVTGLQGNLVQYLLRTILVRHTDIATVGQFLAAMALSHVYVNFVLQAMGMDYLPRLTARHDDDVACNRLVNEQTEVALLLAGPGVVALAVLAPILIPLFYSGRFTAAIEVLRWQCLGVLLKVASWPLGFVLIARGMRSTFLLTETSANAVYLVSFYLMSSRFGLLGAALAYAVLYAFLLPLVFMVVRRTTGFFWSAGSLQVLVATGAAYAAVLAAEAWFPRPWSGLVGGVALAVLGFWAYRQLCRCLNLSLARVLSTKIGRLTHSALATLCGFSGRTR